MASTAASLTRSIVKLIEKIEADDVSDIGLVLLSSPALLERRAEHEGGLLTRENETSDLEDLLAAQKTRPILHGDLQSSKQVKAVFIFLFPTLTAHIANPPTTLVRTRNVAIVVAGTRSGFHVSTGTSARTAKSTSTCVCGESFMHPASPRQA